MCSRPMPSSALVAFWAQIGPYLVAGLLLVAGYLHYAAGTAYSLSAEAYRSWAFPAFRYSDLIWLYLRDHLEDRPIPYVDYPLEYPPLTGLLSWIFSWSANLPSYYALTYSWLALSALATVWALTRISGANAWLFAASPALFFYTGHQWDMAAVAAAALALVAWQRGSVGLAATGLVAATSLKLFPVAFAAAIVVQAVRDRRYRTTALFSVAFTAGTAAINIPVALANFDGWSFFYRWNRDRLSDSGIWVLWRDHPTEDLTRWSLVAAIAGGIALTIVAFRSPGPIAIPLGATYLLWWLLVNKTFTTHLMLWAILSLALISAPWWLWGITTAVDLAGFQLGNYLNLYNVSDFRHAPLVRKAVEYIYDPLQVIRSGAFLAGTLWGLHVVSSRACHYRSSSRSATAGTDSRIRPSPGIEATSGPRESAIWNIVALLVFTAASLFMTWPYAMRLGDATVAGFDPLLQIWLSEWIQHALMTDPRRLFDANIFYPFAQTLAYTDANVPGALIAAPIRALTGDPILTNSLLVLASFVMAGLGTYALIVSLTRNQAAGLVAGLAYAFLPYRMVHLWHLNWLEGGLLPWFVLALVCLVDRPTLGRGAVAGLLAGTLVLVSFYFSVQVTLLVAAIVISSCIARRSLPWLTLARAGLVAAAVALVISAPVLLPYLNVREEQLLERTIVDAEQYKALPASYLQLAPWDAPGMLQQAAGIRAGVNESLVEVGHAPHADGHRHGEIVIEDALYPGALAICLATVGAVAWRDRRWLIFALGGVAAIAFILSMGPTLGPRHGSGAPMPYAWLFDHVALFRAMRVPARLGGLVNLVIVVLAGLGVAALLDMIGKSRYIIRKLRPTWVRSSFAAGLSLLVMAELWTGQIPLEAFDRSTEARAAAEWLATQPPGPVMEFPAESVFADPAAASVRRHYGESMFWSTIHWNPIVNGNSGFIPRAYSDFIERFVGEVPRPDGSTTTRISHLDEETARLLTQLGVKYVVFNMSQYRQEDWPAVDQQLEALTEQGILKPEGAHGKAAIYSLNPVLPAVQAPTVKLFAPTLLTPNEAWAPWVGVESPDGEPGVLALTRPASLETIWYDSEGRQLWREHSRVPLPVVLDEPQLLCDARECLTSRPFATRSHLPRPAPSVDWRPTDPGHYVVRLRLVGDVEIDCRVDLDVVDPEAEVRTRLGDDPLRWAECTEWSGYPINDPGAERFQLGPPSVTFVGNEVNVEIAVTPREDEAIRAWFILAPPSSPEPWREAVFQSPVRQRLAKRSTPARFEWSEAPGESVEPGVYELTVWVHRQGASGWEHATGGDIGVAPIVIGDDGTLRWAGPIRGRLSRAPHLKVGASSPLDLVVTGTSVRDLCEAAWTLMAEDEIAASGTMDCTKPELAIPVTVAPAQYRLQIELFAMHGGERRLSDALVTPVTVSGSVTGEPA